MSKRGALAQLTKDNPYDDGSGRPDDIADPPRKATAAQMAARKIRQAKSRARPGGGFASPQMSNSFGIGNAPALAANPFTVGGAFTDGTSEQQQTPAFSFGQQSQSQAQGQPQSSIFNLGASQSFPPANGNSAPQPSASASFGGIGGGGFNFSGAAQSSGGFTFSPSGNAANPFATANAGNVITPTANGAGGAPFSGSFFGIPPPQTDSQKSANLFAAPSANTQTPQSNLFGAPNTVAPQQTQSTNIFGGLQLGSKPQSIFTSNLESMQTSPDPSPEKPRTQNSTPFSFPSQNAFVGSPTKQQTPIPSNPFSNLGQPQSALTSLGPGPEAPISSVQPSTSLSSFPSQSTSSLQSSSNVSEAPQPNPFAAIVKPSAAAAVTTATTATATLPNNAVGTIARTTFAPASPNANQSMPSNMFGGIKGGPWASTSQPANGKTGFSIKGMGSNSIQPTATSLREPPEHLSAAQKQAYRKFGEVKALNSGLLKHLASVGCNADWSNVMRYYLDRRAQLVGADSIQSLTNGSTSVTGHKALCQPFGNATNHSKSTDSGLFSNSNNIFDAAHSRPFSNGTMSPSKMANSFGASNKRKADEEFAANDLSGHKKAKGDADAPVSYPRLPSSEPAKQVSQTSSLFQSIVDGNTQANSTPHSTPAATGGTTATSKPPVAGQSAYNPFPTAASPNKSFLSWPETSQQRQVSEGGTERPSSSVFAFQPFAENARTASPSSGASQINLSLPSTAAASATPPLSPFQFKPPIPSTATAPSASAAPTWNTSPFKPAVPGMSEQESASPSKLNPSPTNPPTATGSASGFKPPGLSSGGPVNFFGQFGKKAEEDAEKEKAKRKAEEYDSEEEDEAEWERKDAEERAAKKAKLEEATKGQVTKFVHGKGFVLESDGSEPSSTVQETVPSTNVQAPTPKPANALSGPFGISRTSSPAQSTTGGSSVFDSPHLRAQSAIGNNNIFAHLSDAESGAEGSRTGDADDEQESSGGEGDGRSDENRVGDGTPLNSSPPNNESEGETLEDAMRHSRSNKNDQQTVADTAEATPGRSLFDRIKTGPDGKPQRDDAADEPTQATNSFTFGVPQDSSKQADQASSTPKTNLFGSLTSPAGDQTWKQDSPIKFAASFKAPVFSFTPATPNNSAGTAENDAMPAAKPMGSLFGTSESGATTPANGDNNGRPFLFGTPAANSATPLSGDTKDRPFSHLFGTPKPDTATLAGSKPADVGFTFGGPPKAGSSLFVPSAGVSVASSRATSPGLTTDGGESTGEGADDSDAPPSIQVDLTALSEEEKAHEEVLYEVPRAQCLQFVASNPDEAPKWESKGVGPVRVLKNKDNGVTRLLMRIAPSGKIVVNTRLLSGVEYLRPEGKEKMMQFAVPVEDGKLISTLIKVGKAEDAEALVRVCEENKPKKE